MPPSPAKGTPWISPLHRQQDHASASDIPHHCAFLLCISIHRSHQNGDIDQGVQKATGLDAWRIPAFRQPCAKCLHSRTPPLRIGYRHLSSQRWHRYRGRLPSVRRKVSRLPEHQEPSLRRRSRMCGKKVAICGCCRHILQQYG